MVTIYLASPYGFSEATKSFLSDLSTMLKQLDYKVNDPWKLGEEVHQQYHSKVRKLTSANKQSLLHRMNNELASINKRAIDDSDIILAVLDGSDVDSGVASEIGYAYAQGKLIIGYRGDTRQTGDNEGATVNLQVQFWIEQSGGVIVKRQPDLLKVLKEKRQSRRS